MKFIKSISIVIFSIAITLNGQETEVQSPPKKPDLVLVFTKTEGFRHESIATGVKALREMGRKNNFIVLRTESSEDFNSDNLANYSLVVFLSTTMDVLDESEQKAFEGYIQSGGSFLGIHAATDTEYDWPWYGKLVGGMTEEQMEITTQLLGIMNMMEVEHIILVVGIPMNHIQNQILENTFWGLSLGV